jgi:hypothetical protein
MVTLTLSIPLSASNSKIHSCDGAGSDRSCSCCFWCTDGRIDAVGSCDLLLSSRMATMALSVCLLSASCVVATIALPLLQCFSLRWTSSLISSGLLFVDGHIDAVDSCANGHVDAVGWCFRFLFKNPLLSSLSRMATLALSAQLFGSYRWLQ